MLHPLSNAQGHQRKGGKVHRLRVEGWPDCSSPETGVLQGNLGGNPGTKRTRRVFQVLGGISLARFLNS
jgi:hypothetical protein